MQREHDEQTDFIDAGDYAPTAPRRLIVRRAVEDLPEPAEPYEVDLEDVIEPRRLRWWHVAGALFLIAVLLLESLAPVIQGIADLMRPITYIFGEPL